MTEIISLLLTISGVCGAIVTIIGCVTLLAKKPKKYGYHNSIHIHYNVNVFSSSLGSFVIFLA